MTATAATSEVAFGFNRIWRVRVTRIDAEMPPYMGSKRKATSEVAALPTSNRNRP